MGIVTPVMRVVSMLWMPLMELDITIMYYVKGFLKGAKAIRLKHLMEDWNSAESMIDVVLENILWKWKY